MRLPVLVSTCAVTLLPCSVRAQRPPIDSLVAQFVDHGFSRFIPTVVYEGCPSLDAWQRRGIDLLMQSNLTPLRTADLASAWQFALRDCHDQRLEQWYFKHFDAEIALGGRTPRILVYWTAMQRGDSPAIREYLWRLTLNVALPEDVRNTAASVLFPRFSPSEARNEYVRGLESMRMPELFAAEETELLMSRDASALLRDVEELVRRKPQAATQTAFWGLIDAARRLASDDSSSRLRAALLAARERPGLTAEQRGRVGDAAAALTRDTH